VDTAGVYNDTPVEYWHHTGIILVSYHIRYSVDKDTMHGSSRLLVTNVVWCVMQISTSFYVHIDPSDIGGHTGIGNSAPITGEFITASGGCFTNILKYT